MKIFKIPVIAASCIVLLLVMSGCVAVPLVLGGYAVVKAVEFDTKGKTVVTFGQPDIDDTNLLLAIHSIAVWPLAKAEQAGVLSSPSLAEQLSPALKVATPRAVTQALGATIAPSLDEMTRDERRDTFRQVANRTGSDAVLASVGMASDTDLALFKLSRSSTTQTFTLVIYSRAKDEVIWRDAFNVKVSGGEVMNAATKELAAHLLRITGHTPPPDSKLEK